MARSWGVVDACGAEFRSGIRVEAGVCELGAPGALLGALRAFLYAMGSALGGSLEHMVERPTPAAPWGAPREREREK